MVASREAAAGAAQHLSGDKIYCANCTHCKLVRVAAGNGSQYYLRVRCDAGIGVAGIVGLGVRDLMIGRYLRGAFFFLLALCAAVRLAGFFLLAFPAWRAGCLLDAACAALLSNCPAASL